MHWLETLRGMDHATLAWAFYGVITTVFYLCTLPFALDWPRRFNEVRKYADELKEQNEELRKMLADRNGMSDDAGGEIQEVDEVAGEGPGPGETIH